jgi:ribosomal protein L33
MTEPPKVRYDNARRALKEAKNHLHQRKTDNRGLSRVAEDKVVLVCIDCGDNHFITTKQRDNWMAKQWNLPKLCTQCRIHRDKKASEIKPPTIVQPSVSPPVQPPPVVMPPVVIVPPDPVDPLILMEEGSVHSSLLDTATQASAQPPPSTIPSEVGSDDSRSDTTESTETTHTITHSGSEYSFPGSEAKLVTKCLERPNFYPARLYYGLYGTFSRYFVLIGFTLGFLTIVHWKRIFTLLLAVLGETAFIILQETIGAACTTTFLVLATTFVLSRTLAYCADTDPSADLKQPECPTQVLLKPLYASIAARQRRDWIEWLNLRPLFWCLATCFLVINDGLENCGWVLAYVGIPCGCAPRKPSLIPSSVRNRAVPTLSRLLDYSVVVAMGWDHVQDVIIHREVLRFLENKQPAANWSPTLVNNLIYLARNQPQFSSKSIPSIVLENTCAFHAQNLRMLAYIQSMREPKQTVIRRL